MNYVIRALTSRYAAFRGRARRLEYWLFILIMTVASWVLVYFDVLTGSLGPYGFGLLSSLFVFATFIPSLCVSVRRLHDSDRRGWWVLIFFVPLIGW
ncbi:unnamed protein product, partial [marine sediment metagenome]